MTIENPARREALQLVVAAGAVGVAGLRPAPALARSGNAAGTNLDAPEAPAVWLEEHWDVKAGSLPQFLAAHEANVHALARQAPGYRGYTVLTNETNPVDGASALIRTRSARAQFTDGATNWDALFDRAYNVLIIHHIDTWADADAFRARITALHDKTHPGISLADHLARSLFPYAKNYWDVEYRRVATGWFRANDADSRALKSAAAPLILVGERWQVEPERFAAWLDGYRAHLDGIGLRIPDYCGYSVATTLPPQVWETSASGMTAAARGRLGGEDPIYVERAGSNNNIRTEASIDVGALYKKTYNVMLMHEMRTREAAEDWQKRFSKIRAATDHGATFIENWTNRSINAAENHREAFFRT